MASTTIDMVHGRLWSRILAFTLPLMAANILQLLFNAADLVIVGKYAVDHCSLAAVGSTTSLVNLITNLLIGLSVGVTVAISRRLGGGGNDREIASLLHTALLLGLIGGAVIGVVGSFGAETMLRWMGVPDDVRPLSAQYLRIYLLGTPASMLYNYGAAALRARGDTKHPLFYLTIAGVVNVGLNLFLVIVFSLGVAGVAIATVTAQVISATLILTALSRSDGGLRFQPRALAIDRAALGEILRVGIPAGVQGCLFSLSNVVIQGAINSYDSIVIAGSGAASSIGDFSYQAANSFHHTCQTFVSQNYGAHQYERIRRVVKLCLLDVCVLSIILCGSICLLAPQLVAIYNDVPAVVAAGTERLRTVIPFYIAFNIGDILTGAIRGCGIPLLPVIINLIATCGVRLAWVAMVDTTVMPVTRVYWSYPVSWVVMGAALGVCWLFVRRSVKRKILLSEESQA